MINVIIFHGSGSTPDAVWQPWLKQKLEKHGFEVSIPILTEDDPPSLDVWLPLALKESFTPETILIGHSSGAPLILSVLENINITIKRAILIAGFTTPLPLDNGHNPTLQETYDWGKIKKHAKEFIFINGVNDPWGCDDKQGRVLFDQLGGTLIINNEGHMGSYRFHQPYETFPLLLQLTKM